MRRWIKRIAILIAAITLPTVVIIAERGSHALVVPARRSVQDYHRDILTDLPNYGLVIHEFTAANGTPGLVVLPSPKPGLARKSRDLRAELERRGVQLPAFGETIGTLVLFHGRNGRKEDHLPIAERFCAAGFACLCCDLPGHGDSPLRFATYGHEESHHLPELLAAARTVHELPAPTALFGYSQGGAIALQTAAQPENHCFAVASISAFADLNSLLHERTRRISPAFASPTTHLVRIGTRIRAGFDPIAIRPDLAAARLSLPCMIVHGAEDTFIPTSHAQRLHDAIPHQHKSLQIVPSASHHNVLAVGSTHLYADLSEFFLREVEREEASR